MPFGESGIPDQYFQASVSVCEKKGEMANSEITRLERLGWIELANLAGTVSDFCISRKMMRRSRDGEIQGGL